MCALSESLTFQTPTVIRLISPSSPTVKFHLRLCGNHGVVATGLAGFGMTVIPKTGVALLD